MFRSERFAVAVAVLCVALPVGAATWGGGGIFSGGTVVNRSTFTADPADTTSANATVLINPATSAANEKFLCIQDNGTDLMCVDKEGDVDVRGQITNGGSGTCWTGITSIPCFGEGIGANGVYYTKSQSTSSQGALFTYGNDNSLKSVIGYYDTTAAATGLQGKSGIFSNQEIFLSATSDIAAGTAVLTVRDSTTGGTTLASVDGAGNVALNASATRSKGTMTLSAGTQTATVASGSVCVCTDTTANASVKCAVSSTTLTATGTGTDVIAYMCW